MEELVVKFSIASIKYGEAIEKGDSNKANKQSSIIRKIRQRLILSESLAILAPLLIHDDDYVKLNAASSLISIFPEKSKKVLLNLQNINGLVGFEAKMFLNEWEKGNIRN